MALQIANAGCSMEGAVVEAVRNPSSSFSSFEAREGGETLCLAKAYAVSQIDTQCNIRNNLY